MIVAFYLLIVRCDLFMNKEFENFLKGKQDVSPKNSLVENFSDMLGKTDLYKLNDDKSKMVSQLAPPDQNKPPGGDKKEGKPPGGDKKEGKPPGGDKKDGKPPGDDKKDGKPPSEGNDDVSIQQIKVKDKDAVLVTSQKGGDKPSIVVMADESLMQNQEELKKLPEEIGGQGGDNKDGKPPGGDNKDGKPPGGDKKDGKPPGGDNKDGKPPGGGKTPPPGKGSPLKSSNSENNTSESSGSKDKLDLLLGKNKEDKKEAFWTTVMIDDTPKKVLVNVKTFTVLESMGDLKNKANSKESDKKDKGILSTFDFSDTKSEDSKKIKEESNKSPDNIKTNPKKKLEESKNKVKKEDEDCENDIKKIKDSAKNKKDVLTNKESSADKKDDSKSTKGDKIKYETKDYEKPKSGESESLWSSIFSSGTDSDKDKANQKRLEGGSTKDVKVDSKAISTKLPVLKPLNQTTTIKMTDPIKKDNKEKSDSTVSIDKINKKTEEKLDKDSKKVEKDKEKDKNDKDKEKDKNDKDKKLKKDEKDKANEIKKDEKDKANEIKKDEKEKEKENKKDEKEADKKEKEKEKEIKKNEKENKKDEKEKNKELKKIEEETDKKEKEKKDKDKDLKKKDKEEISPNNSKKAIESVIFQNNDKDMKSISAKNSNSSKKNSEASVDDLLYVLKNMPGKVNINKEGKEIYIEGDFFAPKDKKLGQNSFNFSGILKSKEGKKN